MVALGRKWFQVLPMSPHFRSDGSSSSAGCSASVGSSVAEAVVP